MSTDQNREIHARLRQLSLETEAAAILLKQRVTWNNSEKTRNRPPPPISLTPKPGLIANLAYTTQSQYHVENLPQAPSRIDLSGGRRTQTPTPPSVAPAVTALAPSRVPSCHLQNPAAPALPMATPPTPSWVQPQLDAISQACIQLQTRIPNALATMSFMAASIRRALPVRPLKRLTVLMVTSYLCAIGIFIGALIAYAIGAKLSADRAAATILPFLLLCLLIRFIWLHQIWHSLPPRRLVTKNGSYISPAGAIARHFIPLYNIYWFFETRTILCNAIDDASALARVSRKAPRGLGTLCAWVALAPGVNVVLSPLFNFDFMSRINAILECIRDANTT